MKYSGETSEGKTRVRDRVQVYRQHICQLQYQQLKCKEHFQTKVKGEFKISQVTQESSMKIFYGNI